MKYKEAFPTALSGSGIFHYMNTYKPIPFDFSILNLDINYLSRSGNKESAPLIDIFVEEGTLTDENRLKVARIVADMFYKNWEKLYATLNLEYNPIENYRMIEREGKNGVTHNSESGTTTATENATENGNGTQSTVGNIENDVFGFNSDTSVGNNNSNSDSNSDTTYNKENSSNSNSSHATQSNGDMNENRELERSGNIGVTTSQQMIESERNLWNWNFIEQVMKDIDSVLVCSLY